MKKTVSEYFNKLKDIFDKIIATGANGNAFQVDEAIGISIRMIVEKAASGGKIIFIGNGASAAISSHMAADFCKNAGIRALAFNDSSLLTSIGNDHGYRHIFEKPIEMFAEPNDILIAISSSGKSENILRGVSAAKQKGAGVITLSGFDENNPLRKLGEVNFYVPAASYGHVEIVHHSICHCIADTIIRGKNRNNITQEEIYEKD